MFKRDDSKKKFLFFSKEIEDQLDKILSNKNEEIEKILEARIKLLREETEKKIEQNKEEIYQEKKELRHHIAVTAELESKGEELRNTISSHTNQAAQYKKEMLKLTELIDKEFMSTTELSQKMSQLQQEVNDKAKTLKNQLEVKYGIEAKFPESDVLKEIVKIDVPQEKEKLGKIRDLIGSTVVFVADESAGEREPYAQPIEKSELETEVTS